MTSWFWLCGPHQAAIYEGVSPNWNESEVCMLSIIMTLGGWGQEVCNRCWLYKFSAELFCVKVWLKEGRGSHETCQQLQFRWQTQLSKQSFYSEGYWCLYGMHVCRSSEVYHVLTRTCLKTHSIYIFEYIPLSKCIYIHNGYVVEVWPNTHLAQRMNIKILTSRILRHTPTQLYNTTGAIYTAVQHWRCIAHSVHQHSHTTLEVHSTKYNQIYHT